MTIITAHGIYPMVNSQKVDHDTLEFVHRHGQKMTNFDRLTI